MHTTVTTFQEAKRTQTSFMAAKEKKALIWLAGRVPGFINSDHLTVLGLAAMAAAGAGYWWSAHNRAGLIVVILALAVNWLGDSLDGTLARFRNHCRPSYGFYVDHIVDAFSALFLLGGLALSGYMSPWIALGLLVAYLMLSIEVYLATYTLGDFTISYFKMGPTELRLLLCVGNIALFFKSIVHLAGRSYKLFDVGGTMGISGMFLVLIISIVRHTVQLYCREPLPVPPTKTSSVPSMRTAGMVLLVVSPLLLLTKSAQAKQKTAPEWRRVCSAFSASHASIGIEITSSQISAQLTAPDKTAITLPSAFSIRWTNAGCTVQFNGAGTIAAVGIRSDGQLKIKALDVDHKRWLPDFSIAQDGSANAYQFQGVLSNPDLVVAMALYRRANFFTGSDVLRLRFFSLDGGEETSLQREIEPRGTDLIVHTDAAHDRLWIAGCRSFGSHRHWRLETQPVLTGTPATDTSIFSDEGQCLSNNGALNASGNTFVQWLNRALEIGELEPANIKKQGLHQLVNYSDQPEQEAMSPDGDVALALFIREGLAFPFLVDNYVYRASAIAIVGLHPVRTIGYWKEHAPKHLEGVSVDHEPGRTTVMAYVDDHWERREFRD